MVILAALIFIQPMLAEQHLLEIARTKNHTNR